MVHCVIRHLAAAAAGIVMAAFCAHAAVAQDPPTVARVIVLQSSLADVGDAVEIKLGLSAPVPFRIFHLDRPRRLVVDFNQVDWAGLDALMMDQSALASGVRFGTLRAGWTRLVVDLDQPMLVQVATIDTSNAQIARVLIRLEPASAEDFAASAGAPAGALLAPIARNFSAEPGNKKRLVVVLDPGHGGIDPGAKAGGTTEANLMLVFARELRDMLMESGQYDVALSRDSDVFVPLEARMTTARRAQANLLISLHADSVLEGQASGATVYTLSERASDTASKKLAERHDRVDLLSGVDLSGQDDAIAAVLMDLARADTAPRADMLADILVAELAKTVGVYKKPRLSAGFSVLKAPDIPSVLIELGYLSSPRDMANLSDPGWRALAARGISNAINVWAERDAENIRLFRK